MDGDSYDLGRTYLSCIVADGVAIFWMVAGFFLFKKTYKSVLLKTKKNIVVPLVIYSAGCFYLYRWLLDDFTLVQSILAPTKEDYVNVIKTLFTWSNPVPCGSHLWYLYTYILIMIIFPVLKSFVVYLEEDVKREKIFVIMSFAFLIMNDISVNKLGGFSLQTVGALIPACIEIIYGHILYKNREKFFACKYFFIGIISFLGINFIRAIIQYKRFFMGLDNSLLFWFSSLGVLCTVSVIVGGFSLNHIINSTKIQSIICYVGSCTFYIYLIHNYIIVWVEKYGIKGAVVSLLNGIKIRSLYDVCYMCILTMIIFVLSMLGAVLIKKISAVIVKIYYEYVLCIFRSL